MLLYFVENRHSLTPQDVESWGLAYAFDGSPSRRGASNGPGGQGGIVLGSPGDETIGYYPDRQVWHKLPALSDAPVRWLGLPKDVRVQPEQLRRSTPLPGHLVTLADGQQWQIPAARRFDPSTDRWERTLGSRLRVNEAGNWEIADVMPQYAALWETASRWMDYADDGSLSISQAADMCVTAIATNYRVSRLEVGALGLLDDRSTISAVLNAVIDYPTFVAWCEQKKSGEASPAAAG